MLRHIQKKSFSYTKVMTIENSNPNLFYFEYPEPQSKLNNISSLANDSFSLSILSSLMTDIPLEKQSLSLFSDVNHNKEFSNFLNDRWKYYQSKFISNGAYSDSVGNITVRKGVARFLEQRDSHESNWSQVYVLNGASTAYINFLVSIISGNTEAVLIPKPLNLESAMQIKSIKGSVISYEAIESKEGSQLEGIRSSLKEAKSKGLNPKILTIVNPGTFTGNLLTSSEIKEIIELAYKEKLIIIADEKSQEVILGDNQFISFKKILSEHPDNKIKNSVELISINSISHSLTPLNMIGSYSELINIDKDVFDQFLKLCSITLCGNCIGQISVDLQVRREEYLKSLSAPVRDLFDQEKEYNKQMMAENFQQLSQVLNESKKFKVKAQNNSFYTMAKLISGDQNAKKIAKQIEEQVGISAEPGDTFGTPGYIRFDKFSQMTDDKKNALFNVCKLLD